MSSATGRPGMEQWKILVLGVLRLGLKRITTASSPWPTGTDVAELDAWASAPDKCPPGTVWLMGTGLDWSDG